MKTMIIGLGYVGLVAALASSRTRVVVGIDRDPVRLDNLRNGLLPFNEPGLGELLDAALVGDRIKFGGEYSELPACDTVMICVGTPNGENGHDYSQLESALDALSEALADSPSDELLTVVVRSTLSPGTMRRVVAPHLMTAERLRPVRLIYQPEFLREGSALEDFDRGRRNVVGTDGPDVETASLALGASADSATTYVVSWETAELAKLLDNTWHALKVSFANEVSDIATAAGAEVDDLFEIFLADKVLNISAHYMRPGRPYGGSCLPKDVKAMSTFAAGRGLGIPLIGAISESNNLRVAAEATEVLKRIRPGDDALLCGVAFKAGVGDVRESPSLSLATRLLESGVNLRIYDPLVPAASLPPSYAALKSRFVDLAAAESIDFDWLVVGPVGAPSSVKGRDRIDLDELLVKGAA